VSGCRLTIRDTPPFDNMAIRGYIDRIALIAQPE